LKKDPRGLLKNRWIMAAKNDYKKTNDKWKIITLNFFIISCFLFIFLASYFFYLDYSNGIKTLVFKVDSKEIKTRHGKRNRVYYEYEIETEQYPGMTFHVTKKTFELIKIKQCYEIKYYGKLNSLFPVKHIKQIKELPNCNK
ncbi:MAG: hypothetical protein WBP45_06420, partial [Daejeonella sp.]